MNTNQAGGPIMAASQSGVHSNLEGPPQANLGRLPWKAVTAKTETLILFEQT